MKPAPVSVAAHATGNFSKSRTVVQVFLPVLDGASVRAPENMLLGGENPCRGLLSSALRVTHASVLLNKSARFHFRQHVWSVCPVAHRAYHPGVGCEKERDRWAKRQPLLAFRVEFRQRQRLRVFEECAWTVSLT